MIAIVYPQFYGVGGIARYLDSFLCNLPAEHPPIYLIISDEHQVARSYSGIEIIHIPFPFNHKVLRRLNLFIWAFQIRKILAQLYAAGKIQWVNFHFPPLIPGLFLPKQIPMVLTAHTTYLGMSGRYYDTQHFDSQWSNGSLAIKSWMERRIFNQASKVITLTEQGRQEVLTYGFKGPVTVIPNGADVNLFTPNETVEKNIDVLFCGRIEFRKGSRAIAELCRQLIAKKPNIQIYIVGYGEDEAWLTNTLAAFPDNIILTGKVPFSEMISYYNRSRVYASTSYYEGLPGTCLEAMAMQLPVVVWDFLFYRNLVIEGQTGLLSAANDFSSMSEHVLALLSAPQRAVEMGRKGRALLIKEYGWHTLAQNVLKTFQN